MLTDTSYAFTGAKLIDSRGVIGGSNSLLWINNGHIRFIGDQESVVLPDSVAQIDMTGRWIIPGLMDTHIHVPKPSDQTKVMRTLLAFGITTARVAATTYEDGLTLRRKIDGGEMIGPHIITAGRLIDAPGSVHSNAVEVTTVQEVRAAVRDQAGEGVDYIKLYVGLTDSLVEAAIDEAHTLGLKTLGHLGSTSWLSAATSGIDGLTHSGLAGPLWELVPPELHPNETTYSLPGRSMPAEILEYFLEVFDIDSAQMDTLAMALLQHGVEVNPNLVLTWAMIFGDDPENIARFEPEFAASSERKRWEGKPHPFSRALALNSASFSDSSLAASLYETFAAITASFHERGILITAGTDLINPWMTPGVALHEEMRLLHDAGLSSLDVLATATSNSAQAMGLPETGALRTGYAADLVVLSANPLENIENTRSIQMVIKSGKGYLPGDLIF